MSTGLVTLILFSSLLFGLATGLPIAFVLGGIAVIMVYFLWSPASLPAIAMAALGAMDNFILTAVPLFVIMGAVMQRSGIAEDLYNVMYRWLGGIRGGLAIGTVIICTIFAAMSGISGAATIAMGLIALPSMLKYKYDKNIVVGCIAAGGALGILVPPSVTMIIFGAFTGASVGKLFAGGIFPGLLLSSLFIIYILIRCRFQPHLGPSVPPEERATWGEKLSSLKGVALPIGLVVLVLGSIFGGVCTPTEGAAVGALGSFLCAAIYRKLNWAVLKESLYQSLQLSVMVMWIFIGATCFSVFYNAAGAVDFLREMMSGLMMSRYLVVVLMEIILIAMGCFLDPTAIIMVTTPVFVPIIEELGFDLVWFGVLFVISMEMGYLTPPFGFNLFYMKGVVPKGITMGDIYRSVVPFIGLQAICLALCIIFPQIILWAPSLLFK